MKTKMSRLEKFWVLYDVGNSAFTLLVSTIIPIYYKNMASANGISASDSTAYLSYAISISTLIVADRCSVRLPTIRTARSRCLHFS
jgi:UMF1 family MFS transporter